MGFFQTENQKTFKILFLIVMVVLIAGLTIMIFTQAQSQSSRTVLFDNDTYIFDNDANYDKAINVVGVITGNSVLKIKEGISTVDDDFTSLFDIFVAQAPNAVIKSSIPESTDNALVIQRAGPQNTNFIDVVFWDSDTNRPLFVLNAGDPGRASTFDRSLQVGKDFASDILDLDYTVCQGTMLADCNTLISGADLVVEDDIENFGSTLVHENATIDGNLSFSGAFGELFDTGSQTIVTITDSNVFFPIQGLQTGNSRNTLVNDTNITVQIKGHYLLNYSISFSNANNVNYESGIMLDGVIQSNGQSNRRLAANDIGNMAATLILDLNVGNNLSMAISNTTSTADVTIESASFTMTYIGN